MLKSSKFDCPILAEYNFIPGQRILMKFSANCYNISFYWSVQLYLIIFKINWFIAKIKRVSVQLGQCRTYRSDPRTDPRGAPVVIARHWDRMPPTTTDWDRDPGWTTPAARTPDLWFRMNSWVAGGECHGPLNRRQLTHRVVPGLQPPRYRLHCECQRSGGPGVSPWNDSVDSRTGISEEDRFPSGTLQVALQ